jgi:hypothetical protein
MDPRLANLVDLQKAMAVRHRLEKEKAELPERIKAVEQQLAQVGATLQEAEATFKEHERRLREKEAELQDVQAKENKIKGQLFQIKTNKEYQAALQEVENFKVKRGQVEEEVLVLLDTVDNERCVLQERREESKAHESRLKTALERLQKRSEEIDAEWAAAAQAADVVARNVDPDLLGRFQRVFDAKDGVALTPANGDYCHSCQVHLTPHVVQVVKRGQDFVTCEGCSRFLYWDSELGD